VGAQLAELALDLAGVRERAMRPEERDPLDLVVDHDLDLRLERVDEGVDRLGPIDIAVVDNRPAGLGTCHVGMLATGDRAGSASSSTFGIAAPACGASACRRRWSWTRSAEPDVDPGHPKPSGHDRARMAEHIQFASHSGESASAHDSSGSVRLTPPDSDGARRRAEFEDRLANPIHVV
jgi:hypothetical protein